MGIETRYMRSDQQTVNGLTAYKLDTTQSASELYGAVTVSGSQTVYWASDVAIRHSDSSETSLGTKVGQVQRNTDGQGIQSATWNVTVQTLVSTDSIVVRVYLKVGAGSWNLMATFTTEQLGASSLDAATWTFYYYTYYGSYYEARFYWGKSTYNSRIENFTWSSGATEKSFSDVGGGSDAFINPYRAMGFSESGHGVESFVNPFRAMGISDVGHGAEAFNTPFRAMGFSDIGLGSDLFVILLSKAFTDAGLGSDVFTKELIGFLEKAFADSGVGTDAFNIPFKALLFVDAGQGVDSFKIPFKAIMFSDAGQGVDVFVIPFKTMNFSDVANGVDIFALLRELTFSDVGGGIDSFAKTVLEIISKAFADAGMGSDVFLAKHIHKLKLPFLIGMTLDGQLVWIFKQEYDVE